MNNYIISLIKSSERREHIKKQFSKKKISFSFYNALSPLDNSKEFYEIVNIYLPNLVHANLTNGEKGCLLSHFMLWIKCLDDDLPYISIFEDDILLGDDAEFFLEKEEWIYDRFNFSSSFIIKLETFLMNPKRIEQDKILDYKDRRFEILHSAHFGTAGYIISRNAAKELVNLFLSLSPDELIPIDELIFNKLLVSDKLTVYQLNPAICIQELQLNKCHSVLSSQIENDRKLLRMNQKKKRTIWQRILKIKYNLYNIFTRVKRKRIEQDSLKNIVKFL